MEPIFCNLELQRQEGSKFQTGLIVPLNYQDSSSHSHNYQKEGNGKKAKLKRQRKRFVTLLRDSLRVSFDPFDQAMLQSGL